MSPPPTSIDGTDITGATIDGQEVQEITIDGDTVFTAGPPLPDTSMFQSPLYQYTAIAGLDVSDGSPADNWTEQLAGAGDATTVGSPVYRANQSGFQAVEYDGSDDGHNFPTDGNLPTGVGPVSVAATVSMKSTSRGVILRYGNPSTLQRFRVDVGSNEVIVDIFGGAGASARGGSYSINQFVTIGGVLKTDGTVEAYLNGSFVASGTGNTTNLQDQDRRIGFNLPGDAHFDGYIHDVVVCDAAESNQAFSDYHNDRI